MLLLVFLFVISCLSCTNDLDCGSNDQPGLCLSGICQCGIGFSGNQLIDPTSCSLTCSPSPVPDSIAFLKEPNVTISASSGNLILNVFMEPYLKQNPSTVSFLNPINGNECALMPTELGNGKWSQDVLNDVGQCFSHYLFTSQFDSTVNSQCWENLGQSIESGPQYSITFNQYKTAVEVIQTGLAPFGQTASRSMIEKDDVTITRSFRRNYTISVATQFRPTSEPFTLIPEPAVGPTAVNDSISTPQNIAKSINVVSNDIAGYQNQNGVQNTNPLDITTLKIVEQASNGNAVIVEGVIVYTPTNLYHGNDSIEYEICDSVGLCDNATVSIIVTPDPPIANDDGAQCDFESQVTINVLSNDIGGVGGLVTLTIVSQPNSGSAIVDESNNIVYTANEGFSGLTTLTYQICDGSNPTVLCDTANVVIDVDGTGPIAVNDLKVIDQNASPTEIIVLSNDLQGTESLNTSSVRIISLPTQGTITGIVNGVISYQPNNGYHGSDLFSYEVCDIAEPPKCSSANVSITVTPNGPTANDDSESTGYLSSKTIAILSNDIAGAQPLDVSSVSIVSSASNGNVIINGDGSVTYTPSTGFVGSDSFEYEICDTSNPTSLCDSAIVTIVVEPLGGAGIQYRLVSIDYDILNSRIITTVQTRTTSTAKVDNIQLDLGLSSGLSLLVDGPNSGNCDASSPSGSCDQFHVTSFSIDPCNVENAEMVFTAEFKCSDGSAPNQCGYQNVQSSFKLDKLFLSYDACPRVVEFGINSAASYLRLHEDTIRSIPLSTAPIQGETIYGRCSIIPSVGSTFQSVTLSAMKIIQQNGNVDLGDQLGSLFFNLQSPIISVDPNNAVWDFDLDLEPSFFLLTNTYYLEATLDLIFTNTGPLTRKLRMPITFKRNNNNKLRSSLLNRNNVQLVAIRDPTLLDESIDEGLVSEIFGLQARSSSIESNENNNSSDSSSTAMIVGIAAAVGLIVCGIIIVVVVVVLRKKRKEQRSRANSDAPLNVMNVSTNDLV